MRDLTVLNYRGVAQTTLSQIATADVRLLAESTDEELLPALTEGDTCESVRERCKIELLIRELGL